MVIKSSARQDVHAEARACQLAHRHGIPVPRVIAFGHHETIPGGRWLLMTRLSGVAWNSLPPDQSRDMGVLEQLGRHFAALHVCRGNGFGAITSVSGGEVSSWSRWLRQGFSTGLAALEAGGVTVEPLASRIDAALSFVDHELRLRPCALVHGDLGDGEVFIDPRTGHITGLTDWGSAIFGDPLYEFARFVAGGPVDDTRPTRLLPTLRAAYAGYTEVDWQSHRSLMDLYDAYNALHNAVWALHEGLDWAPSLCHKSQRLLSRIVDQ